MNRVRMAWNVALLLLAGTSLFAGLTLLDASTLSSVLIIVGAMGFLMSHTGRARLRWPLVYAEARGDLPICWKWQSNYTLRRSFRLHDKEKMNVRSKSKL